MDDSGRSGAINRMKVGAQNSGETPTQDEILREAIRTALMDLHTAMPGTVQSYDGLLNLATVQPSFKRKYVKDEEVVDLPIINNVPVAFPRAGDSAITFPLKQGDSVLLVFAERSLDKWLTEGGEVSPDDPRTHDLADAIAIPGVYPKTSSLVGIDTENLVIRKGNGTMATFKDDAIELKSVSGQILICKDGKVSLGNGVVELLDLLDQTIQNQKDILEQIQLITVPTVMGPSGVPNNVAAFKALDAKAETFKKALGTIKK